MNIGAWLAEAIAKLDKTGVGTARLDCLVLLEDITGKDRAWLLAHPETVLQDLALKKLQRQIVRRARHEPLAYVRGKTEFYGREFAINKHVLEPRPESETMIELLKQLVVSRQSSVVSPKTEDRGRRTDDYNFRVVDVGTGSGALAITAKLELPEVEVFATDIDPQCLKVARQNAHNLGAEVTFLQGDLLDIKRTAYSVERIDKESGKHPTDLPAIRYPLYAILANLPYVPDSFTINQAAMNEPRHAIFGGPDGLDLYRRLFDQINTLPVKPRHVLTESLPFQHTALAEIAQSAGYKRQTANDFIQVFQAASTV